MKAEHVYTLIVSNALVVTPGVACHHQTASRPFLLQQQLIGNHIGTIQKTESNHKN